MDQKRCEPINKQNFGELLASTDAVFFDCDGTLWRGSGAFPGAISFLNRLLELGKQVGYVTNNSCRTHLELVNELKKRGFPVREPNLVISTTRSAALYLAEKIPPNSKVFLVASSVLATELEKVNIRSFTDKDFDGNFDRLDADAVVCGLDPDFTYRRLEIASHLLRTQKNAIFLATNCDTTFPGGNGRLLPDCGPIAAAVSVCSGRPVDVWIGKPGPILFDQISKFGININPRRVVMVGDRCETDIAFASSISARSILVLSGISSLEEAKSYTTDNLFQNAPHFIAPNIGFLNELVSGQQENLKGV